MNCADKIRYPTKKMADEYVSDHNKEPLLKVEEFIQSYHCDFHQGWHVGHSSKYLPPHIRVQEILDRLQNE